MTRPHRRHSHRDGSEYGRGATAAVWLVAIVVLFMLTSFITNTAFILNAHEVATIRAAALFWRGQMSPHDRRIMRPCFRAIGSPRAFFLRDAEISALSQRLIAKRKR
jgi:hypothetical protein